MVGTGLAIPADCPGMRLQSIVGLMQSSICSPDAITGHCNRVKNTKTLKKCVIIARQKCSAVFYKSFWPENRSAVSIGTEDAKKSITTLNT